MIIIQHQLLQKRKTWTICFVYVHLVSPNTNKPLSNKSPRHWREHPLLLFWLVLENLAISVNKNLKQDASQYVFFQLSQPIGNNFLGFNIMFTFANIENIFESTKRNLEKVILKGNAL